MGTLLGKWKYVLWWPKNRINPQLVIENCTGCQAQKGKNNLIIHSSKSNKWVYRVGGGGVK